MKYVVEEQTLYAEDGSVLKRLQCPLSKTWESLAPLWPVKENAGFLAPAVKTHSYSLGPDFVREILHQDDPPFAARRWCCGCDKAVINISGHTEEQVRVLLEHDRSACIYCPIDHPLVKWIGAPVVDRHGCQADHEIIRIRTLRQPQAIREALRAGQRLLVQLPDRSGYNQEEVSARRRIMNSIDELLAVEGSLVACGHDTNKEGRLAAYVLHDALKPGDRVALIDLLETIGISAGRGGSSRATGLMATWTGTDFDLDIDKRDFPILVG